MTIGEFAAVTSVSVTAVSGILGLVLRAQYERMRREITSEISDSRHETIDRLITHISEVQNEVQDKVSKELHASQFADLRRRVEHQERMLERLLEAGWSGKHPGSTSTGHG